jgi:hypothetical protein
LTTTQGLRETTEVILSLDLGKEISINVLRIFNSVVEKHLPNYFEREKKKLDRIISRGKIRNENEYYILRLHMDKIEELESDSVKFERFDALLMEFENANNKKNEPIGHPR